MTCSSNVCGTGDTWGGTLPGDPDNVAVLSAVGMIGGVEVSWTMPTTNPFAVAHTLLYRGIDSNYLLATQRAVVDGNTFFDSIEATPAIPYYYWIQLVSVNGTYGDPIGPAVATPKLLVDEVIEGLTGRIDAGVLSQSLKGEIDKITLLGQDLTAEITARILAGDTLGAMVQVVQDDLSLAYTYLNTEIQQRTDSDNALLATINTMVAQVDDNSAALQIERITRADEISALAGEVSLLYTRTGIIDTPVKRWDFTSTNDGWSSTGSTLTTQASSILFNTSSTNAEFIKELAPADQYVGDTAKKVRAKVRRVSGIGTWEGKLYYRTAGHGYDELYHKAIGSPSTPDFWNILEWDMSELTAGGSDYLNNTVTGLKIDLASDGNTVWEFDWVSIGNFDSLASESALQEERVVRSDAVSAVASSVTTLESTVNGNVATGEVGLVTKVVTLDDKVVDIGSLYTVKLNVNGLAGGFGVYNDGTEVEAGFDVDTFWIGRTGPDKVKPFIVSGGVVYIDNALINQLTADHLDTRDLEIKDSLGNVIFSATNPLDWALVAGANRPADNATKNTVYRQTTAPASPVDGDVWINTSTSPVTTYGRVGGVWQVIGNYTTDTGHLTDGANLGGTATWNGVTGSGKPADNATRNLVYRQASAPGSPNTNDLWVNTSSGTVSGIPTQMMGRWNGSSWEIVAATQITSGNVGSILALKVIGGAYIDDLSVSTLKIANNAVTIPVSSSGTTFASTSSTNFEASPVVVMCFGTATTINASSEITVTLKRGTTTLLSRIVGLAQVSGDGLPDRYAFGSLMYLDWPSAGSHSYSVTVSGSAGATNAECVVVALGVKK